MAIALRGVGTAAIASTTAATTLTPTLPSGWQPGDIHLLVITLGGGPISSISDYGGFTVKASREDGSTVGTLIAWRRAQPGDTDPVIRVDTIVADPTIAQIIGFSGCVTSGDPITATSGQTNAASRTITCPALTPTDANSMIVLALGTNAQATISGYSGSDPTFTEALDTNTALSGGGTLAAAYGIRSTATSTGSRTATATVSATSAAVMVALRPAADSVALAGTIPVTIEPSGTGQYGTRLTGEIPSTVEPSGTLTARTALTGETSITVTPSGVLAARLALTGALPVEVAPSGRLTLDQPGVQERAAVILERQPLRVSVVGVTPGGREFRWAGDEPDPANRISGLRWSAQMPGGWEEMSCVLPRKPSLDYGDLERLSTLTLLGAGAEIVGEFRLERAPRVSGNQMSVAPAARGWQAHLEDDRSASVIFIDRDLGRWQGPGAQRRLNLINQGNPHQSDPSQAWDTGLSQASLVLGVQGAWTSPPRCEAWYDAGPGNRIARIRSEWNGWPDPTFHLSAWTVIDSLANGGEGTGDVYGAASGVFDFAPSGLSRYGVLIWQYGAAGGSDGAVFEVKLFNLRVHGDHGLPLQAPPFLPAGYLASDMAAYTVGRWAPLLRFTMGANGTVYPSSFVVPQAAFHDPTTAASIIGEVNKYELYDWAVWEGREFHYYPRGLRGRRWMARVGPSGLEETGPQADRIFNGIIVTYNDVDGSTRTAGPIGSGCDTESASLLDLDPENPANQLNIRRWGVLQLGMVSTANAAIAAGARFLQEAKLLDTSGRARFTGYVEDEHGTLWPYYYVRAGDTVEFVDAADRRPRRIVRADYDADARTVSVDLDSPPEGLQALLARMQMSLSPYGM
jgi:hypothetical protein